MDRFLVFILFEFLGTFALLAQDDTYFVPSKKSIKLESSHVENIDVFEQGGSTRDVDEYNRYVAGYDVLQDTISFRNDGNLAEEGGFDGEELMADDYAITKNMTRFDNYYWTDGYISGFIDGSWSGIYSPWPYYYPYRSWWRNYWFCGYWPYHFSYHWYDPYFVYPHYGISHIGYNSPTGLSGTLNKGSFRSNRDNLSRNEAGFSHSRGSFSSRRQSSQQKDYNSTNRRFGGNKNNRVQDRNENKSTSRPSINNRGFGGTRSGGTFSSGGSNRQNGSFGGNRSRGSFGRR